MSILHTITLTHTHTKTYAFSIGILDAGQSRTNDDRKLKKRKKNTILSAEANNQHRNINTMHCGHTDQLNS